MAGPVTPYAQAAALLAACEAHGARFAVRDDGRLAIEAEALPEALRAGLAVFSEPPVLDEPVEQVEAKIARSTYGATASDGLDSSSVPILLGKARDAGLLYRALRAVVCAPDLAVRELLTLPVSFAVGLPHPFSVVFRRCRQLCVATTSREAYAQAEAVGAVAFVLRELEAAALAVELERAYPVDLDRWIAVKQRGAWRLTPELATEMSVFALEGRSTSVTFGELFDALGAELVSVDLHAVIASNGAA